MKQIIYHKGHLKGRGMGSVLLGGVGSASSYRGIDDYEETTGRQIGNGLSLFSAGSGLSLFSAGSGLSAGAGIGLGLGDRNKLNKKLESLNITPKKEKSKNIRFNL